MDQQLSIDEQAAAMAEKMLKGGAAGSGDMPTARGGSSGAEGGFTPQAGGKTMEKQYVDPDGMALGKGGPKVTDDITSEPGRQGQTPRVTDKQTAEPKGEVGGGAGEPANVTQDADDSTRARKPGQVGVSGGSVGGGMPENEDQSMRGRKDGKVGIAKGVEIEVNDDDEEEEEEEKACKKSIDADDLIKSLETLEAIAQGANIPATPDRRAELAKGLEAGQLTAEEMVELSELMKAGLETSPEEESFQKSEEDFEEPEQEMEKSFQERWGEDGDLAEGYDVSPFLERQNQLMAAGLDEVREDLAKSLGEHRMSTVAFNTQLAKSLRGMVQQNQQQAELIKSLQERLDVVENTPLPRKGVSNVGVLNKSMEGEVGQAQGELGRTQIFDALEEMAMKSERAPCGEPIMRAVAMFENEGKLSKSLYNDVVKHIRGTVH